MQGYDHMEVLGHTLTAIAGEKAGILKRGCPAFTVPQEPEAMAVLQVRTAALPAPWSCRRRCTPPQHLAERHQCQAASTRCC